LDFDFAADISWSIEDVTACCGVEPGVGVVDGVGAGVIVVEDTGALGGGYIRFVATLSLIFLSVTCDE